ncbi:hypothetical protein [Pseudonocardia endophytica]|uniref:Uncharacterized protein n=1 Tax=Pseudonocardia endophytica TaxID=401976 RepID=A0A4R1HWE9_PSEEN|nr:hypothetical protein [Pseudonocardia endophytica]TCK27067.1 hypothetical protein EV378_2922 [Pseudonocardia endophytica]
MQLGTSTIPLLPAVAVGVAVVLAGLVLWGVLRVRSSSGLPAPTDRHDARAEPSPEPGARDWTGEAASGEADPPRPPRRPTVADAVAARGADTQPMPAVVDADPPERCSPTPAPALVPALVPLTVDEEAGDRSGAPPAAEESSRPVRAGQHRLVDDEDGSDVDAHGSTAESGPGDRRAARQWRPRHTGAEVAAAAPARVEPGADVTESAAAGAPVASVAPAASAAGLAASPELGATDPAGSTWRGQNGSDPHGSDPHGSDPTADDLGAGDPHGSDPSADNLGAGGPGGGDPHGSDPSADDLGAGGPGGSDPQGGDPQDGGPGGGDPHGNDPSADGLGAGGPDGGDHGHTDGHVVPDVDGDEDGPDDGAADVPCGAADAPDGAADVPGAAVASADPVLPPWSPERIAASAGTGQDAGTDADSAGSPEPMSFAVQQALAARAVQRARGRPDVPDLAADDVVPVPVSDARDRLLSVLLTDPATAVGATTELDDTRARIDQIGDVLRRRRADLATAVHRLHASGLTGEQIGELAGLECADVQEILQGPSGEGSGGR